MARGKRRSRKSKSTGARGGKSVKLGGRQYKCRAKRVKAFGRRTKVTRAYCKRAKK